MHSAGILKAWVVPAPQAIDSVRLFNDCFNHLLLVVRKIVRNVQHDIANKGFVLLELARL